MFAIRKQNQNTKMQDKDQNLAITKSLDEKGNM
jgi:hypothetical protein